MSYREGYNEEGSASDFALLIFSTLPRTRELTSTQTFLVLMLSSIV